ncbi:hypothetical protein PHLGIDRAFT_79961 [Phlebiopsis gigantea 11061_1 CR5-6]|uniref:Concanavalin A-like lectin/glucanase n=1 Tax=Phlebiopsis gigantea (strain 11061_1 CR5-6) TaxID=745531 RepID=A0A0C3RZI0_PHLG1|nr:hypothetical protein PHLGIDRAFT_79961 [Phlebiopsis gigantea 11061_1 CR5-6]
MIIYYALLASSVLAIPSSRERFDLRQASRGKAGRSSLPKQSNVTHPEYSSNWAGSVIGGNTWKQVTGTFTVPVAQEPVGGTGQHAASVWVGIDGDTCQTAIFQTGIDLYVNEGTVTYDAWSEWWPYNAELFSGITINAGDSITLTVLSWYESDNQHATAIITNNANGQVVEVQYSGFPALCEQDAEWIVEDFQLDGAQVPFANFGTITFTSALAYTYYGAVSWPAEGDTWNIVSSTGQVLTSVTTDESTTTISYIGN